MNSKDKKRKRIVVSIETKIEALKRLDKGESFKSIALHLGVGEVTVGDWKRNRAQIEKYFADKTNCSQVRKTMKHCEFEKTSEALFLWFTQLREKGSPVSGPMLKSKALDFHKKFYNDEPFTASVGWLDRWKKRYGIRQLNITGEKLSADSEAVVKFKEDFHKFIKENNISRDQLFNADETGLNFRMLPSKTLAARKESSAPGYKKKMERITILNCCNASGTFKFQPMIIGKSKKPRAFKNCNISSLPVYYRNKKNAWMSGELFKKWFSEEFVPKVEIFLKDRNLERKALLLLDNAACHPDEEQLSSGDIKAYFLPPNVTSLAQPLDQGVLENLKRNYRKKLLGKLIEDLEEKGVTECLKEITLKDAVYWIAEAWEDIQSTTLQKSWRKILSSEVQPNDENEASHDESLLSLAKTLPVSESLTEKDIDEWMNADEQQEITDDMIADMVENREQESSDEENCVKQKKITHSEGLKSIEKTIEYIEQQEEATPEILMNLTKWRSIAAKKRLSIHKQKNIKDYFK